MEKCFIYKVCFLAVVFPFVLFTCTTLINPGYRWEPVYDWVIVDVVEDGKKVQTDTMRRDSYEARNHTLLNEFYGREYILIDSIPMGKRWDQ